MPKTVALFLYKLTEGSSVPDFLLTAENLNKAYMSKQKGYIFWQQLLEGDTWADLITWETMEDAQRVLQPCTPDALAEKFYSFIDMESCKVHVFSVEKDYQLGK